MEDATVRFGSVDWASLKHSACVVDGEGRVVNEFEVAHDGAGLSTLSPSSGPTALLSMP